MTGAVDLTVYVFETTIDALWAEDVALERGIPAEVVSAPAEAKAKCGIALRTTADHAPTLEGALDDEGVPYRIHG